MERYVLEGNISVKAAVLGGVRPVYEILVDEQKKDRDTTWILYRAKERDIPIRRCPRSMIDALAQSLKLLKVSVSSGEDGSDTVLKARILDRGVNVGVDEPVEREVSGIGNGPIAAFLNAVSNFGIEASVMDYVEHTMSVGTDAMAASYVECQIGEEDNTSIVWGVGIDTSIVTSSLKAIISAINRSER